MYTFADFIFIVRKKFCRFAILNTYFWYQRELVNTYRESNHIETTIICNLAITGIPFFTFAGVIPGSIKTSSMAWKILLSLTLIDI